MAGSSNRHRDCINLLHAGNIHTVITDTSKRLRNDLICSTSRCSRSLKTCNSNQHQDYICLPLYRWHSHHGHSYLLTICKRLDMYLGRSFSGKERIKHFPSSACALRSAQQCFLSVCIHSCVSASLRLLQLRWIFSQKSLFLSSLDGDWLYDPTGSSVGAKNRCRQ